MHDKVHVGWCGHVYFSEFAQLRRLFSVRWFQKKKRGGLMGRENKKEERGRGSVTLANGDNDAESQALLI